MVLCIYALTLNVNVSNGAYIPNKPFRSTNPTSSPVVTTTVNPTTTTKPTTTTTSSPTTGHTCVEAVGPYAGWYANSSVHYTECKTCGKTMRGGSHSKKNASDTTCRYCGYTMSTTTTTKPTTTTTASPSTGHTCVEAVGPNAGWYANSSVHYTECKTCGKTMRSGSHSKKNASDTTCRYCGYAMSTTATAKPTTTTTSSPTTGHTCVEAVGPNAGWYANSSVHYTECKTCGKTMRSESHSKKNASDTTCRYCGYTMSASSSKHTHTIVYGSASNNGWFVSSAGHWMECSGCSAKLIYKNQNYVTSGAIEGTSSHVLNKNTGKCTYCYYPMTSSTDKEYTIKTVSSTKGTVSASKSTAKAGETITITATANVGYKFSGWSYGKSEDRQSATTTFVMPKSNVTISATFVKDSSSTSDKHEHISDGKYYTNYLTHYNKCTVSGCKEKINETQHTYSPQTQKCVCGKKCPHSKKIDAWYQTETVHYKACSVCLARLSEVKHQYNGVGVCKTCGYIKGTVPVGRTDEKYEIKIKKSIGGEVTASASMAKAGETITITAIANTGYKIKSWPYGEVTDEKSATGTFTMPNDNVTISVSFEKDNCQFYGHKTSTKYDNTYHWKVCSVCEKVFDKEVHKILKNGNCTGCKYHEHEAKEYSGEYCGWKADKNYHWEVCKYCFKAIEKVPHTYIDGRCNTCGYVDGKKYKLTVYYMVDGTKITDYSNTSKCNSGVSVELNASERYVRKGGANTSYNFDSWKVDGASYSTSSDGRTIVFDNGMPANDVIVYIYYK